MFKFSRPVQENSGGVLTVKLDYVLKGGLVDIIPVLIMKNRIDTSSYSACSDNFHKEAYKFSSLMHPSDMQLIFFLNESKMIIFHVLSCRHEIVRYNFR